MDDQFLVLTPEKVVVSYRVCGIGTRLSAHLLDVLLAGTIALTCTFLVTPLQGALGEMAAAQLGALLSTLVFLLYFVLFEWLMQGSTPGKRAARARVVMCDGTPITFSAALYRNLMRPADFLPALYLVGFLSIFANSKSQRLGDLAAGTVVIAERPPALSYHPAPHHVGIHRHESSVGELSRMTIDEYYALKRICDRSMGLPPETMQWSVENVWRPFATKHSIMDVPGVHPLQLMEAVVMKYGRMHKLV